MTRIRVKNNIVNLRVSPDLSRASNILTTLRYGTMVDATRNGDWWQLTSYLHTSIVETLPEPLPLPEGAIPYISQWDTEANQRGSDCGQTCTAMLARWRGIMVEVDDLPYQSDPKGLTTGADLVRNFNHISIAARWRYLAANEPAQVGAICLVKYSGFDRASVQDDGYLAWHWQIMLREDTDTVTVHDPDFWGSRRDEGAFKVYSRREWDRAFIPSGASGRVVVEMT